MSESEKISLEELKEQVDKAVETSIDISKSKQIPVEVLEGYKELIGIAVVEILDIVREMYDSPKELLEAIRNFMDVDITKDTKIKTEAYVLLSVPLIFPVEIITMVENSDDFPTAETLVNMIAQLSGIFIAFCLSTNTDLVTKTLGDDNLSALSEMYAKKMKEKGFIS